MMDGVPSIHVSHGFGYGTTDKSAFDQALDRAGVAQFNLIPLSSVVPHLAGEVVKSYPPPTLGDWGDRLYCVVAEQRSRREGSIAAGIGWLRHQDGRGVFVEHHARDHSDEAALLVVRSLIEDSLNEMGERRGWKPEQTSRDYTSIACGVAEGEWACALVVAVFETAGWESWPARRED
jgi:arginine decarboxylase